MATKMARSWGVYGQRYAADGAASGNEFLINSYTRTVNTNPLLQRSLMAGLWLTWQSDGQDGSGWTVFMPAVMSQALSLLTVT